MTKSAQARAIRAANPDMPAVRIADALSWDPNEVRRALRRPSLAAVNAARARIPDATIAAIRADVAAGFAQRAVARRHGVSRAYVRDLADGLYRMSTQPVRSVEAGTTARLND